MRLEWWKRGDTEWTLSLSESDDVRRRNISTGTIGWLEDGTEFRVTDVEPDDRVPGKEVYTATSAPLNQPKNQAATLDKGVAGYWMVERAKKLLPGGLMLLVTGSVLGQAVTDWGKASALVTDAEKEKDPSLRFDKAKKALTEVLRLRNQPALKSPPVGTRKPPATSSRLLVDETVPTTYYDPASDQPSDGGSRLAWVPWAVGTALIMWWYAGDKE